MLKRIFYLVPIAVLIVAGIFVGSFWLVPKDRLNGLIAKQLSEALGYEVTLSGRPSVQFFPYLNVSFGPLRVTAHGDGKRPLMEIERASGRLSTRSLWEGNPALRFIDLERARIFLMRDETGTTNWSAARFFAKTEAKSVTVESGAPELRFPKKLKRISLIDSTLTISDPGLDGFHMLTKINATITGPPRSSDLAINGSFVWRGEPVSGSLSIARPGAFMAGAPSSAKANMTSPFAKAAFTGNLAWSDMLRGDGTVEASITSAPGFLDWLGLEGGSVLPAGELQLVGSGIFTPKKFSFRPIGIRFGASRADGRLELDLAGRALGLGGSLAFDRLVMSDENEADGAPPSFLETLLATGQSGASLDLRLSADSARIAGQEMSDMAVGVILKESSLVLNIGSASLNDNDNGQNPPGQLRGEIAVDLKEDAKKAKASLTFGAITMSRLENALGLELPLSGAASVSFQAAAEGKNAQAMENTLDVQIVADIQNGEMSGVNFAALLNPEPFSSTRNVRVLNGISLKTPFSRGRLAARMLPTGILDISELSLEGTGLRMNAGGRADIVGDRLSMLGKISGPAGKDAGGVSFTLGGSLSIPRVSSVDGVPVPSSGNTQ